MEEHFMTNKWIGRENEQTDEILNENIDSLENEAKQLEETTESDSVQADVEDDESDETCEGKKFIIGFVGKLTDRQRETIKLSAKHIAGFSKKLNYDEIEVVELSENDEENEGIYVDVKIDKNKEISKFAESGLGMSLASKCMPSDFQALFGSGKNRRATKKKRRK